MIFFVLLSFFMFTMPVIAMYSDEENTPPPQQPVSNIRANNLLSLVFYNPHVSHLHFIFRNLK